MMASAVVVLVPVTTGGLDPIVVSAPLDTFLIQRVSGAPVLLTAMAMQCRRVMMGTEHSASAHATASIVGQIAGLALQGTCSTQIALPAM